MAYTRTDTKSVDIGLVCCQRPRASGHVSALRDVPALEFITSSYTTHPS